MKDMRGRLRSRGLPVVDNNKMASPMSNKLLCALCLISAIWAVPGQAAVSQAEANRLGNSLTPFGAIRAGNSAGTIPRWDGGDTRIPDGYGGTGSHHVNPYPDDEVLYSIDINNLDEYRDRLGKGVIAMMETYPDTFRLDVYETRRSHTAPAHVIENTRKNATRAELMNDGNGMRNAFGGYPFPILHGSNENQAMQAMWNHLVRWRGRFMEREATEVVVVNGQYRGVKSRVETFFNYNRKGGSPESLDNIINYYLSTVLEPKQYAGGGILVHETLDQVREPRKAWGFSAGRVREAPSLGYDSPIAAAGNLRTVDDTDVFNGALDRYNWTYRGREEILIPYNNFLISEAGLSYDEILGDFHLNPDLVRWELHRVHVVEANLREDARHLYHKRVFYIDEDSWNVAMVDQYDNEGQLWRVTLAMLKNFYELPGVWTSVEAFNDLKVRRYHVQGLDTESPGTRKFSEEFPGKRYFSPFTLRRRLLDY